MTGNVPMELLAKVNSLPHIAPAMPYLLDDIDKQVRATLNVAMDRLDDFQLDGDEALRILTAIWALERMRKRLQSRMKMAEAAADEAKPHLDGGLTAR